MRKFFLPICLIAIVSLTSCSGNPPETEETAVQPATTTQFPAATDSSATPAGLTPSTATTTPSTTGTATQPTQATSVPVQQKTSKATAGLNPAHGQPGHRCDIEVGAPLSSAPTTPQVQQSAPPVTATPAPTTPAPKNGTVKLNPAHGQPGHDCAIPVGQPLKG